MGCGEGVSVVGTHVGFTEGLRLGTPTAGTGATVVGAAVVDVGGDVGAMVGCGVG